MTYNEMKTWFLILQDKYGSPYYTDSEIAAFLNRAQIDEVVGLLPVEETEKVALELNQDTIARVMPLIFFTSLPAMDTGGNIFRNDIEATVGSPVLRILALTYDGYPIKWTRHNNFNVYVRNVFKAPTATRPRYWENGGSIVISPANPTAVVTVSGLIYPATMLVDGSVNCVLPAFTHNSIVARALSYAGVGSRDQMLTELKQANQI